MKAESLIRIFKPYADQLNELDRTHYLHLAVRAIEHEPHLPALEDFIKQKLFETFTYGEKLKNIGEIQNPGNSETTFTISRYSDRPDQLTTNQNLNVDPTSPESREKADSDFIQRYINQEKNLHNHKK